MSNGHKESFEKLRFASNQVKGRVAELALNHKASRILQSCAKHGTAENRAAMLEEVLPQFLELTKSCYASFLLKKLISTASKPQLQGQVPLHMSIGQAQ